MNSETWEAKLSPSLSTYDAPDVRFSHSLHFRRRLLRKCPETLSPSAPPTKRSETMAEAAADGNASRSDNASVTLTDQRPLPPFLEVRPFTNNVCTRGGKGNQVLTTKAIDVPWIIGSQVRLPGTEVKQTSFMYLP